MSHAHPSYVPAAGRHWALPFYDLLAKALGADAVRALLVERASPGPGQRVLEIGCGTGSLLLMVKRAQPGAEVVGLDPDPGALEIARRKAARAGLAIRLDPGFSERLPYADGSFDHVLSSLMFHHLSLTAKEQTLREVRRVLRPGGRFHLVDLDGTPGGGHASLSRLFHSGAVLRDNAPERVLGLLRDAGLADPAVVGTRATRLGRVACYRASAPPPGAATA